MYNIIIIIIIILIYKFTGHCRERCCCCRPKTNTSACWPGPVSRLHTDKGRVTYRGATHTTPQTLDGPTEIDEITRQVWLSLTMFNMCTLSVASLVCLEQVYLIARIAKYDLWLDQSGNHARLAVVGRPDAESI